MSTLISYNLLTLITAELALMLSVSSDWSSDAYSSLLYKKLFLHDLIIRLSLDFVAGCVISWTSFSSYIFTV